MLRIHPLKSYKERTKKITMSNCCRVQVCWRLWARGTDSGGRYVRTCRRAEYAKSGGWYSASLRQLGGEMNDREGKGRTGQLNGSEIKYGPLTRWSF